MNSNVEIKIKKEIEKKFCFACGQPCVYTKRRAFFDKSTGQPVYYTDEKCPKVAKWYGFLFKDSHQDESYNEENEREGSHWSF